MMFAMAQKARARSDRANGLRSETIGRRIARLRTDKGLTQVQLAKEIGVLQTHLSGYERGKVRLHVDALIKLSEVLQVSVDELLGLKARREPDDRPSLRLVRRLKKIEKLSPQVQKTLLRTIDLFVKGVELEEG